MRKETLLTISLQGRVLTSVALRFENDHVILSLNFRYSPRMAEKGTTANIHFAGDDLFVGITPSGHAQAIETDSARSRAATPMELLLIALGSCTGVDVISILKKQRQEVTNYRIEVRGQRRSEFPRSYTRLEVKHILRGRRLAAPAVARAIELSDQKYCSVAATLRGAAEIFTSYEIEEEDQTNEQA
jgi:putative redox protein